ncbi:MAG TPA: hypothetical protein VFO10_18280 [Oligoflexus sp.]|uniref:hypothetical protein n=1 Tax=Oligoflexus sp. TaxID=1971216 RepID=UPI002D7E67C6|nr:hypothetical protein [Oligoflexus sp.]HET9239214.1 hypothetical protein [Oligoflexus sp.]
MKISMIISGLCLWSSLAIAGIKQPSLDTPDFSKSLDANYEYAFKVSATVTPLGVFSSISVRTPVKLKVSCDGNELGEASFFYNKTMKNQDTLLSVTVRKFLTMCPSANPAITIEPNGIELDIRSPFYTAETQKIGRTVSAYKEDIENKLEKKAVDLVKAHSLMSSVSGSQESFHCLIVSFESDALIPIESVDEIKGEYKKLYGTFKKDAIKCPATGVLADRIATCAVAENKFTLFCVLYDRVVQETAWFAAAMEEGEAIVARESDANMIGEINLLLDKIKKSKEAVESQFGA